ncbi:SAM hydrolase/SAM-dependent halogenase family protein [Desulfocastanea catecholica]
MTHPAYPLVTLITDFGLKDEYVGVVKGVILCQNPALRIVDISHLIPPQDISSAAHLLTKSYGFFPPGSVHLVIVDPGVGSDRPLLAIHSDGYFFVGPDNGIFTPLLNGARPPAVHRITESALFLPTVSTTFHGRDIMAPVAAQLATGLPITRVGPPVLPKDCLLSGPRACAIINGVLHGEIIHVDRFGNLCTNISRRNMEGLNGGQNFSVQIGEDAQLLDVPLVSSYVGQKKNGLLALYDSHDFLEIAVNRGNAAQRLQAATGCRVLLFRR